MGTLPVASKLIGGSPHVKVACISCGCLIWTAASHETKDGWFIENCSDCDPIKHKSKRQEGRSDKAAGVDIRYNGN